MTRFILMNETRDVEINSHTYSVCVAGFVYRVDSPRGYPTTDMADMWLEQGVCRDLEDDGTAVEGKYSELAIGEPEPDGISQ